MAEPTPQAVRDIFLEVVTLSPLDRVAVLEQRCADDPTLRSAVEALLESDAAESFLVTPDEAETDADATIPALPRASDSTVSAVGLGPGGRAMPGTMVGPYRIEAILGVGGMGEVYRALDTRLDRGVALKSIRADRRLGEEARQRFEREARILSSLDHPNICRLYDYFSTGDRDFLVLELIEGYPLDAVQNGLPPATRLRIAEQIASVLVVAHAAGIVHRDLKPENVMITRRGNAKVLDFGIARPASETTETAPGSGPPAEEHGTAHMFRTSVSGIIGTPMYMSPEQARGQTATVASDMYAFGLMLQHLFTEQTPYPEPHDLYGLLESAKSGNLRPVRGIRGDVATLIRRLTRPAPSGRLTAVEAVAALRRIRERTSRWIRRALIAAALIVVTTGVTKYTIDLDRERTVAIAERDDALDMVLVMVTELVPFAKSAGQLAFLETLGETIRDYIESRPEGTIKDEDLYPLAVAIGLIGQARLDNESKAVRDTADELFVEQIEILTPAVARHPGELDWVKALGDAIYFRGLAAIDRGDYETAIVHYDAQLANAKRLVAAAPNDPEWQLALASAHANRAQMLFELSRTADALSALDESDAIKRKVYNDLTGDAAQEDLWGRVATRLANGLTVRAEELLGNDPSEPEYDSAQALYLEAEEIFREIVRRQPTDAPARAMLGNGLGHLSKFYFEWGQATQRTDLYERALAYGSEQAEIFQKLAENDPINMEYRLDLATARDSYGTTLRRLERFDLALEVLRASRREWDVVLERLGNNSRWNGRYRIFARPYLNLLVRFEAWAEVLEFVPRVRNCLAQLDVPIDPEASPPVVIDLRGRKGAETEAIDLARLDIAEGRAHEAQQNHGLARAHWERATVWLEPFVVEPEIEDVHFIWLEAYAEAMFRLGRPEDAEPYAREVYERRPDREILPPLMRAAGLLDDAGSNDDAD